MLFSRSGVFLSYLCATRIVQHPGFPWQTTAACRGSENPAYILANSSGAILKRLQMGKEYVSPGQLAILYAALGEPQQAFTLLERAYNEHDLQLQYLGVDPASILCAPTRASRTFCDASA